MKHLKTLTAVAAALTIICLVPTAKADEWDKKTILTTNAPIEIPGRVLEAGTYVMVLNNSPSDRHIVQVFDKDQQHLITTILAIPNYRMQPTGKTQFTFWEVPAGQPQALQAWFYPGDNFGQEFTYPKEEATKIAVSTHTPVPTTSAQSNEELATAPVTETDQSGTSSDLDRNSYTAPQSSAAVEPAPAPSDQSSYNTPAQAARSSDQSMQNEPHQMAQAAPSQPMPQASAAPTELPRTASNMPLLGLIGLIFLLASGVITMLPTRVR